MNEQQIKSEAYSDGWEDAIKAVSKASRRHPVPQLKSPRQKREFEKGCNDRVSRNERGATDLAFAVIIAAVVVIIAVLIVLAIKQHNKWEAWCHAQGGHVDSSTQTGVGTAVGSDGKVSTVTTSSTTYYCLSDDGGVLGVE